MDLFRRNIAREKKTIGAMIDIYCREKHGKKDALCPSCQSLLDYAHTRLERCPFGENKTACADCKVHCYVPNKRHEIVDVMRFSGPRMMLRHPVLAVLHSL